jgi:ketosteroid isomerase-like protein
VAAILPDGGTPESEGGAKVVSEHIGDPRIETVVHTLEAYRSGDLQAMQRSMVVDVTLEAVGNNALAGTYQGIGGVIAFIGRSMSTFVADTVKIDGVEARGDEIQVTVTGDVALRNGGQQTTRILQRYWFTEDGRIARVRNEAADDPDEFDRLLAQAKGIPPGSTPG